MNKIEEFLRDRAGVSTNEELMRRQEEGHAMAVALCEHVENMGALGFTVPITTCIGTRFVLSIQKVAETMRPN